MTRLLLPIFLFSLSCYLSGMETEYGFMTYRRKYGEEAYQKLIASLKEKKSTYLQKTVNFSAAGLEFMKSLTMKVPNIFDVLKEPGKRNAAVFAGFVLLVTATSYGLGYYDGYNGTNISARYWFDQGIREGFCQAFLIQKQFPNLTFDHCEVHRAEE